jgi:membrane associated rhomboid family serine protease
MFPIGEENSGRRSIAIVVFLLLLVNIFVFLVELTGGEPFIAAYAAVPYEISHGVDLTRPVIVPGLGVIPQAPGPAPIYLTLFTSMFMHAGLLHLAGNMLYLWIFGRHIEDNFGHLKFLAFYLICGVAAAVAQIAPDPDSVIPALGASGAIAGVLGAYLVMFPGNRIRVLLPLGIIWTTVRLPAVIVIGFWIVLQLFSGFATIIEHTAQQQGGGVAYLAHIGGFIAGVVLSFFFRRPIKAERGDRAWS